MIRNTYGKNLHDMCADCKKVLNSYENMMLEENLTYGTIIDKNNGLHGE